VKQAVLIDLPAVLLIHEEQIEAFGGTQGVRDTALLESAIGQARHTLEYTGDIYETAAQYAYSIARNHPFLDGNKRTAAACMLVFLNLNALPLPYSADDIFSWAMQLATGDISRAQLAERLRNG